jgi:glycosyltransferase involved in cell wall biosynthesis
VGERDYDVAVVLNYYAPYVSGLTEAARVVAEGLAGRGWRVAVVAARHDSGLPERETIGGVDVHRCPVVGRISKGVVAPTFPFVAANTIKRSRVGLLNLPMLEAGLVTRLVGATTPIAVTYQCDVVLGSGFVDKVAVSLVDASSRGAAARARVLIASTTEYAERSRILSNALDKTVAIAPPHTDRSRGAPRFRRTAGLHVGFLGRIVEEKGVEYLVEGFRRLTDPDARLLIAGEVERVAGGTVTERVRSAAGADHRIELLGFLPEDELADFYASLDVFVLPSVNSLEAFGIVQVEAMSAGVPVIASDLPGVAVPVRRTGFGRIVPPRDPAAIHDALEALRRDPPPVQAQRSVTTWFGADRTIDAYERLLADLRCG